VGSELHWIVGPARAAVRRRDSRIFSLWARPSELGRVPMGLHMALNRPDEDLYADPSASRALVRVAFPTPRIPLWLGWTGLVGLVALAALGRTSRDASWVGWPSSTISTGSDLALVLVAAAGGYALAAAWEAAVCAGRLVSAEGVLGLGAKGPSVEPSVWRLGLPAACAWLALLGPLAGSAAVLAWAQPWPTLGSGLAMGAALYVMRIALPIRPGPTTRLIETVTRVPDFSAALRWALTTWFLPASQRPAARRPGLLAIGALALLAWIIVAGTALPLLVSEAGFRGWVAASTGVEESGRVTAGTPAADTAPAIRADALPLAIWRVVMSVVAIAIALWLVEAIARLFRYALLFGGRVEREPVTPSEAARGFWLRESALTRHVPAIAALPWQWSRAAAGTLLVRQGDVDRTFHWLASGEARVVVRDDAGNLRQLATLRGGSGVGERALLEKQPRMADVVVSRTALVVSLSVDDFDRGLGEEDRRRFRQLVLAGRAFARSPVFRGCPAPDRERWIRGGAPSRHRAGDTIIAEGGSDRWMGLVVEGRVGVRQGDDRVAELGPSGVFGELAFLYLRPRNATLVAETDALLWTWEPEWLEEEVVRTGLRADLEALAEQRAPAS